MRVCVQIVDPTGRTNLSDTSAWRIAASVTGDDGRTLSSEYRLLLASGTQQRTLNVQGPPDDASSILVALQNRLGACPDRLAMAVLRAALAAPGDSRLSVQDIARGLHLSRRTLACRLRRSRVPTASDLIQWARLLRVGWALQEKPVTVAVAAAEVGFATAAAFRGVLQRHARMRPRSLHGAPGWDSMLGRLASTLRRPLLPALAALLMCAACGGKANLVQPPEPPVGAVTIRILVDSAEQATAQALGWSAGVPAAEVTVTPVDSSAPSRTARTDAQGRVAFGEMPLGHYLIEVRRALDAPERSRLPAGDDAVGFFAKENQTLKQSSGTEMVARAARRRQVIFSEWSLNIPWTPALGGYYWGGFLEIYNNADTTIYLDGMAVAHGFVSNYDYAAHPCALYRPVMEDPLGIWALDFQVFPGRGGDHPLAPGKTAVIAIDAIDHRSFFPGTLDLSGADFEFAGGADVDNPAVPNMVNTGFDRDLDGHGMATYRGGGDVVVLVTPLDTATLPRASLPGSTTGRKYPRIPRNQVLDAVGVATNYDFGLPVCDPLLHPDFDRRAFAGRGRDEGSESNYSVSRRVAAVVGGRKILMHTRTSDNDFLRSQRTPGVLP